MSEQQVDLLSEHQAPEMNTTAQAGYSPSNDEKRTIKLAYRLFEKAKAHRKRYDENMLDYYKMFRGKQWKEQRPSYRHAEVINMIFQHIQASVPLMTDSRPRINYIPTEPGDFEISEVLNKACEADWEKYNWLYTLTEKVFDANIYGTGITATEFDAKAEKGVGAISYETIDPIYFYPDPEARDVNCKRARYHCVAEPVDIAILKRDYPDKARFIKADLTDLTQDSDRTELSQVKFKSPTDSRVTMEGSSPYEAGQKDRALKITIWIAPNSGLDPAEVVEEPKETIDEATGVPTVEYEQRLKYPTGRKICIAAGILLHDGPNPYEDGRFPFSRLVNYADPRSFWGISEIEQLKGPQKVFNKLVSFALDVLTLMGNPVWKVADPTVDTDSLFNRPGLIIDCNEPEKVQREEGVQLQPYVLQLIDRMKTWFDDIGGDQDVSRGVRPEGITAASAINALQDAAKTRIRLKTRNLDASLQDDGQHYQSRAFQFYSAPRMFRLTNNQNVSQYFKMSVNTAVDPTTGEPQLDEAGNPVRTATLTPYEQDPATGAQVEGQTQELAIKGGFDVRVNMGSSLPFAKDEKVNLAKFLMEAGAIDSLELLKAVEYPNAEAVYQQVQERKMQEAQMQASMAPPPAPGASAAPPPAA